VLRIKAGGSCQECSEELCADRACKMRPPLAPIEALTGERTSPHMHCVKINAYRCKAANAQPVQSEGLREVDSTAYGSGDRPWRPGVPGSADGCPCVSA
jgi:hypothetical protein